MQNIKRPKVAVIITTHNDQQHIHETVNSVINQKHEPWECILVDNGSKDNTYQISQEIARDDTRFLSFQKENEGPSAGRNLGFSHISADAEYVFFLDGDDQLAPDCLEVMVAYLESNPKVGLLGCQFNRIDEKGNYLGPGFRSRWVPGFLFPRKLKDREVQTPFITFFCLTGQGPFALFRRSVLEQTTLYDTDLFYFEDADMFCQMSLYAEVHYIGNRLYNKREHRSNFTKTVSPVREKYHHRFRNKWDHYTTADPQTQTLIRKSRKYYYNTFVPFRDFKVAVKAMREFIFLGDLDKLSWSKTLFLSGIKGMLHLKKTD